MAMGWSPASLVGLCLVLLLHSSGAQITNFNRTTIPEFMCPASFYRCMIKKGFEPEAPPGLACPYLKAVVACANASNCYTEDIHYTCTNTTNCPGLNCTGQIVQAPPPTGLPNCTANVTATEITENTDNCTMAFFNTTGNGTLDACTLMRMQVHCQQRMKCYRNREEAKCQSLESGVCTFKCPKFQAPQPPLCNGNITECLIRRGWADATKQQNEPCGYTQAKYDCLDEKGCFVTNTTLTDACCSEKFGSCNTKNLTCPQTYCKPPPVPVPQPPPVPVPVPVALPVPSPPVYIAPKAPEAPPTSTTATATTATSSASGGSTGNRGLSEASDDSNSSFWILVICSAVGCLLGCAIAALMYQKYIKEGGGQPRDEFEMSATEYKSMSRANML